MKFLSVLTGILTLVLMMSCVSENEQKGLDYIGALYGGETSYSKSFKSESGEESTRTFNVKIKASERIDTLEPTVTTSNIALLMYESFTEEEKEDYTHIDIELINKKNDTAGYYYPVNVLKSLSDKSKSYKIFSQSLVDKDYDKIDEIRNPDEIKQTASAGLEAYIDALEKKHGDLIGYEPFGIAEGKDDKGIIYQFQGYLLFENGQYQPYLVVLDAAEGEERLIGFRIF